MTSFITLINENQLTIVEKKQVFENIKTEFGNLLTSVNEVKENYDSPGFIINELDMNM